MPLPTTAEPPAPRRVRVWWVDALLLGLATMLAELALHEAVVLTPAPIPPSVRGVIDAVGLAVLISPLFAWTLYRRQLDAKYARVATRSLPMPGSPHHRVRVAVLSSLGVFAVLVAASLWVNLAGARALSLEVQLIDHMGRLRLHGDNFGRFAARPGDDALTADSLRAEGRLLAVEATALQQVTASAAYRALPQVAAIDSALAPTLASLGSLQRSLADGSARSASWPVIRERAEALESRAGLAAVRLQRVHADDVRLSARSAWGMAVLALALLAGIALLVVEPVVRLLRRQHVAITTRSLEYERLAMVAERTSSAIVITDAVRNITWVNNAFTTVTGYALHEVVGKSPGAVLQGPDTDPATVVRLRAALDAGESVRVTILNVKKSGEPFWLDLSIEPLRERGEITGFLAITADITELVTASEALQRERAALAQTTALLEEAQQLARMGSWSFDLASQAVEWSAETFHLLGRDPRTCTPSARTISEDYAPEDSPRLRAAVEQAIATGAPYSLVLRTAGGNPAVRYLRADGRARLADDGAVVGLYGTITDVTEAVEREEALRLAQMRAEAANRSKSEFLANMSHEIRTPLTAILGFTDVLRDDAVANGGTPEQLQAMETIQRAGEHLLSVINDVLDLSKIEAGKLEVETVTTPLPTVLLEVESLMRARASAKGVVLETRLLAPVPDRILSDPTRLRQILMNLVGNAAKFTERGRILVETGVEDTREGTTLVIAVDDTGAGMTEEQVTQLFQPFTQADSSVTRRYGGTGLGLTICRRLAHLMGGELELVQTSPGRGTRFELRLPLQAPAEARPVDRLTAAVDAGEPSRPAHGSLALDGRILLAEDGEDNQRLIALLLRAAGAIVTVVSNGREAMETLDWATSAGAPFDLLLTDMQMPEMDGYSLARALRAQGATIPIVALTAHAMADDRLRCLQAGCDDYATKPIDRRALIATCARWMAPEPVVFPVADGPVVDAVAAGADEPSPWPSMLHSELQDDPALYALVGQFAQAMAARVDAIGACVAARDSQGAARLAHQLKGAAGSYGYPSVSDLARRLEHALHAGDATATDGHLAHLAHLAAAARLPFLPTAPTGERAA